MPVLPVSLQFKHAKSNRIDALVDSGAFTTYFHSQVGKAIGIKVEDGEMGYLKGVVNAPPVPVHYHDVKLWVFEHCISIRAGFYDQLAWGGILGRHGFFEHFSVLFDPSSNPPGMEITRIHRA